VSELSSIGSLSFFSLSVGSGAGTLRDHSLSDRVSCHHDLIGVGLVRPHQPDSLAPYVGSTKTYGGPGAPHSGKSELQNSL